MYTYLHIPFCKAKCSYCDFFSVQTNEIKHCDFSEKSNYVEGTIVPDSYVNALLLEAEFQARKYNISSWKSLYFGGGTPGLLTSFQVKTLLAGLLLIRPLDKNAEVTFEVNPYELSIETGKDYIHNLSEYGVNRISCGIQVLNDVALSCIKRRSSKAQCLKALTVLSSWKNSKYSSDARPNRFSIDLISGLPTLTTEQFKESLITAISYDPDHVSLYSLILEENTELYKQIEDGIIDFDEDLSDYQWLLGKEILSENGYNHYEVSNFAKSESCESEHNKAYWRMDNYVGIGCAACGTINGHRYTVTKDIKKYCQFWNMEYNESTRHIPSNIWEHEELTDEEKLIEYLMMAFRTSKGVNAYDFFCRFGIELDKKIGKVFDVWLAKGLASKKNGYYSLNDKGIIYLNAFLEEII